jgi:hypothetical protein
LNLNPMLSNFLHLLMVNVERIPSLHRQYWVHWVVLTQFPSGPNLWGTFVCPLIFLKFTSSWNCPSQDDAGSHL